MKLTFHFIDGKSHWPITEGFHSCSSMLAVSMVSRHTWSKFPRTHARESPPLSYGRVPSHQGQVHTSPDRPCRQQGGVALCLGGAPVAGRSTVHQSGRTTIPSYDLDGFVPTDGWMVHGRTSVPGPPSQLLPLLLPWRPPLFAWEGERQDWSHHQLPELCIQTYV